MEGRHIPGFYYDAEKKKYFKVQPGRLAPAGTKYTLENIRKEKEETKKRKRDEGRAKLRSQHLVQTNKALRTPALAGLGVTCENGLKRSADIIDDRSQAFIGGLEKHTCLDLHSDAATNVGLLPIRGEFDIQSFEYDSETQGLILGLSQQSPDLDSLVSVLPNDHTTWPTWFAPNPSGERDRRPHYSYSKLRPITHFQSPISSTQLSSSRTLVTTTTGSRYQPTIHLTQLLDPSNAISSQPLDVGISTLLRPPNVSTIWVSAPNPFATSSTENIAIGSSNGIIMLSNSMGTWRSSAPVDTESDVLALDWLSANTLAAGCRDASVMLYDARSRGSVKRLRHAGAVIGIKRADDESRLVVCGLTNSLCMYDLRMLRDVPTPGPALPASQSKNSRRKERRRWRNSQRPTSSSPATDSFGREVSHPVLRFEYDNASQYPLGFDVHAELGLVAASEETGNVQIYSMNTGEKIRRLDVKGGELSGKVVKCLRFVADERGVERVVGSCGERIVEFGW